MFITLVIIIVTVVASIYAWNRPDVFYKWMFNPYAVRQKKEYRRLLTSGFIHADQMHLFFNMFTLFFFAQAVVWEYGNMFYGSANIIFVFFYLSAILVSDIPTLIKYRRNPNYNSLGASGGVSAVLFASILFDPLNDIYVYFIRMPGVLFGALYLIYSYYQGKRSADNVNHDAHLYGALYGVFFNIIIRPSLVPEFFESLKQFKLF